MNEFELAYVLEDSYRTLPGTPTWRQPLLNLDSPDPSWENQLQNVEQPDQTVPTDYGKGNAMGTATISGDIADANWHELVFAYTNQGDANIQGAPNSEFPSSTWYFNSNTPDIQQARFAEGAFPTGATLTYEQGAAISLELPINYAYEPDNTTPAAINQPSESDVFWWNGMTVQRSGVAIDEVQNLTIDFGTLAQGRRNQSRYFTRAVHARPEPTMTLSAMFNDASHLELAYGSSGASTPEDTIGSTTFTFEITNGSGDTQTITLHGAKTDDYSWGQLTGPEDHIEDVTFRLTDISVTTS